VFLCCAAAKWRRFGRPSALVPGSRMSDQPYGDEEMSDDNQEEIPFMQKLLDNPFQLLFLGVMIPMVVYTLWGIMEILIIPVAK
jgi:hypothetical protein